MMNFEIVSRGICEACGDDPDAIGNVPYCPVVSHALPHWLSYRSAAKAAVVALSTNLTDVQIEKMARAMCRQWGLMAEVAKAEARQEARAAHRALFDDLLNEFGELDDVCVRRQG